MPRLEPGRVGSCVPPPRPFVLEPGGGGGCMDGSGGRGGIVVEPGRVRLGGGCREAEAPRDDRLVDRFSASDPAGTGNNVGVTGRAIACDVGGLEDRDGVRDTPRVELVDADK